MGFRGVYCFLDKLKGIFQEKLISGENIKTINGESLLGSGDIAVSGGGNSTTETGNWLSTDTGGDVHGPVQVDEELKVLGDIKKVSETTDGIASVNISDTGISITNPDDTSDRTYYTSDGIRTVGMDDENYVYATDGSYMGIKVMTENDINEICV